jgi:hypothetical protein
MKQSEFLESSLSEVGSCNKFKNHELLTNNNQRGLLARKNGGRRCGGASATVFVAVASIPSLVRGSTLRRLFGQVGSVRIAETRLNLVSTGKTRQFAIGFVLLFYGFSALGQEQRTEVFQKKVSYQTSARKT